MKDRHDAMLREKDSRDNKLVLFFSFFFFFFHFLNFVFLEKNEPK